MEKQIVRWLSREPPMTTAISVILVCTCISAFGWIVLVYLYNRNTPWYFLEMAYTPDKLLVIAILASGEEVLFRMVPFMAVLHSAQNKVYASIFVTVVTSYLFAKCHAYIDMFGLYAYFTSGVVFSVVYLKLGGFYNKPAQGLVGASVVHYCTNLLIGGLARFM